MSDDLSDEVCPVCGERVYAAWIPESPGEYLPGREDKPVHETSEQVYQH